MVQKHRLLQPRYQVSIILLIASFCYFPFINKAIHIDSDMLVHTARQIIINPLNPPLGEYGRHMILHDYTQMPPSSVYYRCGHPPLLPALIAGTIVVFGDKEWVFHAFLFLFYLAAIYSVWVLLGLFFPSFFQFFGTVLWTVSPSLLVNSHNIMWDVPITALMLTSFVLFLKGLRSNASGLILLSGIVTGLAALTKVNALPLYLLIGTYLLVQRKWKFLVLWAIPAVTLPMIWVVHNLIVFHKIHYISIGWFGFRIGDMRYRVERFASYYGGAMLFPVFWYWLLLARRHYRQVLITSVIAIFWGALLVLVLKKTALFGFGYAFFTSCGLWLFYRSFTLRESAEIDYKKHERILIGSYALLYALILVMLPSASVRYMLPMIPVALIVLGEEIQFFSRTQTAWFLGTASVISIIISISLAVGDYELCSADRRLPSELIKKGYFPEDTWYYGRLSFDYYLSRKGFKNLRIGPGEPKKGDFLIDMLVPGDYNAVELLPDSLKAVPVDTIDFYKWPVRTMGFSGGFYGKTRLPYSFRSGQPQKSYCIYRLK